MLPEIAVESDCSAHKENEIVIGSHAKRGGEKAIQLGFTYVAKDTIKSQFRTKIGEDKELKERIPADVKKNNGWS